MHQIKQLPEDFVVKETSNVEVKTEGKYLYFELKKKNWNTLDAVKEISKRLKIPIKNIGFAGSKDKKAITEQVISIKNAGKERVKNLQIKDVSLGFLGYGDEPICLGDLEGNYFEIVIRNLDSFKIKIPSKIVNYFDKQRFGRNNIEVGKNLIKKNFKKACEILELEVVRNDYIGALKTIPKRLLRMYVNAYQSYIWNETVKEIIKNKIKINEVPLVGTERRKFRSKFTSLVPPKEHKFFPKNSCPLIGFGTELDEFPEIKDIVKNILEKEKINLNDFIIKQIPELSLEGDLRKVFVEVKDFKVLEEREDELNKEKKKIKISFILPKGSYATMVVKEIFAL